MGGLGDPVGSGRHRRGPAAFHVPAPAAPGWFFLSVLLGIVSLFSLFMFVAAAAPTASSAAGVGWLLFFPNMFLARI